MADSNQDKITDLDWSDAFASELNVLRKADPGTPHPELSPRGSDDQKGHDAYQDSYLSGVCLSGGGIRSAILCYGMLEALSKNGIFDKIDYLTSVSGGGYTGAAVSYWRKMQEENSEAPTPFPPEPHTPTDKADMLDDLAKLIKEPVKAGQQTDGQLRERVAKFISRKRAADADGDEDASDSLVARYRDHLRRHVNYLMPGGVRDAFSGTSVVIRAILLNLAVWLTLGACLVAALRLGGDQVANAVGWPLGMAWAVRLCDAVPLLAPLFDPRNIVFALSAGAGVLWLVLLVLAMVGFSVSGWFVRSGGEDGQRGDPDKAAAAGGLRQWGGATRVLQLLAIIGLGLLANLDLTDIWPALDRALPLLQPIAAALAVLGGLAYVYGLISKFGGGLSSKIRPKYARRRFFERTAAWLGKWAIVSLAIAAIPVVVDQLDTFYAYLVGKAPGGGGVIATIATLSGVGAAIFGYVRGRLQAAFGAGASATVVVGAVIFIYSAALLTYILATQFPPVLGGGYIQLCVAAILATALGFFTNINDVSLGRFYRDRLMEAFLPDRETLDKSRDIHPANRADTLKLEDLACSRPLHLVCCNLVPTSFSDRDVQRASISATRIRKAKDRMGESFVLSRLHCGSALTKWRRTGQVANGNLTLPTAMATSGAAANPHGGFAGTGPTATTPVSLAMALLSLRLGYWLNWPNPGLPPKAKWNPYGNHFSPGFDAAMHAVTGQRLFSRTSKFLEITDGGHFDNLGLYELVRRRCGLIIVCDGGEDPTTSYSSLTATLRRIADDFGTRLKFDIEVDEEAGDKTKTKMRPSGPQDLVMRKTDDDYPKDVEFARKGYFLASLHYPREAPAGSEMAPDGPDVGLLIYLKSTLLSSVEPTTKGYRGTNAAFPYDPTKNQFFSAEQFEAYRDVGLKVAEQMISDTELATLFRTDDGKLPHRSALLRNYAFNRQAPVRAS